MIRGFYTGASGMLADITKLDIIANNLANVDTTGFKQDISINKSFPEMLIRRESDNGLNIVPAGSWDDMPIVGKLGTGVEVNEVFTKFTQGALKRTDNPLDLALQGSGFLTILTSSGERYTRDGAFFLSKDNYIVNKEGHFLLGEKGPIKVQMHNYRITESGEIIMNQAIQGQLTSAQANRWERPVTLDKIKLRDFPFKRELKKEGANNYFETPESGPPINVPRQTRILQGFLEKSNVNVVKEMVRMIEVQRHYEANQKVIQTEDSALGKLINQVAG